MDSAPFDLSRLRTAASIGILMLLLACESATPFFDYFRGQWRERLKHGLRNVTLSVLNVLMVALGFSLAWAAAANWSEEHQFGLLHWLKLSRWLHLVFAILFLDFWTYWWHWLIHPFRNSIQKRLP